MRHASHFSVAAFLSLALVATVFAQVNQEPPDLVRIDTSLVTITAQVMDRDGRFITDLKKQDFQIFEDDIEQEISMFDPVEEPFTILFLLDVSGSMTPYLSELAEAANTFVRQLRPEDSLIAMSFCDEVRVLSELELVREIRGKKQFKVRICGGGYTYVYDAVHQALKRMTKVSRRKAIVLFSDGFSSNRFATAKSTLREAEEHEALIYTIQFSTPNEPRRYVSKEVFDETIQTANAYMMGLAQKTGGRHYRVEDLSDLTKTFAMVADELRRKYSLGYYPKRPLTEGQRRKITVRVRRPGVAVLARDGYVAVPPQRRARR